MKVALIGSNFSLKGYLPVIKKIKKLDLKIICSRKILNIKDDIKIKNIIYEKNWKNIFKEKIDLIILAVPPKVQEKILLYNIKYKKKIFFEKPISSNVNKSEKIFNLLKKNRIRSEINLTYLNHELFHKVKSIIQNNSLGPLINYDIRWSVVSYDFYNKVKSWKTDESKGGGIKNIFMTHILSYCRFLFGKYEIQRFKIKKKKFFKKNFKSYISLDLVNHNKLNGKILLFIKKRGYQSHLIKINFLNGNIKLFTNSKDWTKDFILEIKKNKKQKSYKMINNKKFDDGRCFQIHDGLKKFINGIKSNNLRYCLDSEKNMRILK